MIKFIVVCAGLAISGTALADTQYTCKSFAEDYGRVANGSKPDPANSSFSFAAGFLMGAYRSKTEAPEADGDIAGLGDFERKVASECAKKPNLAPSLVILDLAKSLDKYKPKQNDAKYQQISVTDFQLDAKKLTGKLVEVSGVVQYFGGTVMIGEKRFSTNKIFVDDKALPREQRKYILQNCEGGCEMTIRGKASNLVFDIGIAAQEAIAN